MNDNIDDAGKGIMSVIVRLIGMILLLAGLCVALAVLLQALSLYREPQEIERLAAAIEKGSNIDQSLTSFRNNVVVEPRENETEPGVAKEPTKPATPATTPSNNVRVSYFLAWVIALLLLLLTASISLRAIKTGGELVLYDMQIKQFAKLLVKETSKTRQ